MVLMKHEEKQKKPRRKLEVSLEWLWSAQELRAVEWANRVGEASCGIVRLGRRAVERAIERSDLRRYRTAKCRPRSFGGRHLAERFWGLLLMTFEWANRAASWQRPGSSGWHSGGARAAPRQRPGCVGALAAFSHGSFDGGGDFRTTYSPRSSMRRAASGNTWMDRSNTPLR